MVSEALKIKASKIISDNRSIFQIIHSKFSLTSEQILEAFIYYNSGVEEIDNSIYESLGIRAAMFIEYLVEDSWHQERQNILVEFLKFCNPKSIIDIGFGAPTKYVNEFILKEQSAKLTLADKFDSAFDFAEIILQSWQPSFRNQITFKKIDLNYPKYLGNYEAYIFQDTIEHSTNPKEFLTLNIQASLPNSWFIFSLPIAPTIPCHYISWINKEDALNWIESCGLKIIKQNQVFVNPEIDEFAKNLGDISNLMLITQRND